MRFGEVAWLHTNHSAMFVFRVVHIWPEFGSWRACSVEFNR
jgi:hypothetical protein